MTAFRWDFFIAHAGPDKRTAEKLYDSMQNQDPAARIFLDSKNLQLGDDWDIALSAAQNAALITIVLVSAATEGAYYQREEVAAAIAFAREQTNTHLVVPVYMNDNATTSKFVPYGLRLKHGLTLSTKLTIPMAARQLLILLRGQKQTAIANANANLLSNPNNIGNPGKNIKSQSRNALYDSLADVNFPDGWTTFRTSALTSIAFEKGDKNEFALAAMGDGKVGVNKSVNLLSGQVEFEYMVGETNETSDNIIFYMIPMRENSFDKAGYIEVGTDEQDHPQNEFSAFRQKLLLFNTNGDWKTGRLKFDFSGTPGAFYSMIAPRINEGCPRPAAGKLTIKNIRVFKR